MAQGQRGRMDSGHTESVVEVIYDLVARQGLSHGAGFVRRQPDKNPRACTFEQLTPPLDPAEIHQFFARPVSRGPDPLADNLPA